MVTSNHASQINKMPVVNAVSVICISWSQLGLPMGSELRCKL
jgi:hypothetical protein